MTETEFFTRERAIGLLEGMVRQLEEDRMTDALRTVLTGGNAHGIHLAKYALETALSDMRAVAALHNNTL